MQSNELLWSIPSTPFPENAGAFDCIGPFCAIGVSSFIYVVEVATMRVVGCLSGGHAPQSRVTTLACTYAKVGGTAAGDQPRQVLVASGDSSGVLVTWLLHEGTTLNVLTLPQSKRAVRFESPREDAGQGGHQAIRSICWSGTQSKLLVTLYEKSEVAVWDYLKGQVVWQQCLNPAQELTHMVQSPFDRTNLCVTNDEGLVYILFVTEDANEESVQQVEYRISASDSKFMRCKFDARKESLLHIVLERTLIAFDVDYGIPVGSAALPKSHGAFQDVLCVHFGGGHVLCSHQDGSVSVWECSESKTIYSLISVVPSVSMSGLPARNDLVHLYGECKMQQGKPEDLFRLFVTTSNAETGTGGYLHYFSASDFRDLKGLKLDRMLRFLPQQCTAFSLQPANARGDSYRVALGTNIGTVEILDLVTGNVSRSFMLHHRKPVLGVKWIREDLILSFSVDRVGNAFTNHLVLLDVPSGGKTVLRGNVSGEPTALRGVRTSKSGRHFLLIFKNSISELWRLDPGTLSCTRIRVMNMPFTCVEFVQHIPVFFLRPRADSSGESGPMGAGGAPPAPGKRERFLSLNSSLGTLMATSESPPADASAMAAMASASNSRSRSNSQTGGSSQGREILVFALPDRTMGAVEISHQTRKLKDLKPSFPFLDISPGEAVSAICCTEQTLIVGTSQGELKLWSQSRDQYGSYKLANWEGSVRKIISDPCFISSDFLILSNKNMFHRINVDTMPLRIERTESNLPGTEILDATWVKNDRQESGRQYVMCTKDGVLLYADQAVAFKRRTVRSVLLDPKTPERLGLYMQRGLPLEKLRATEISLDSPAPWPGASTSEVSAAMGDLLIDVENSTIIQDHSNGGGGGDTSKNNLRVGEEPSSSSPPSSSPFVAMASELGLTDLECQQAFESYKKFVAEVEGEENGLSELIRHYAACSSGGGPGLDPLDCMKLVASHFSKSPEEFAFWDKLPDTMGNVLEGNYGGRKCLWDAVTQKNEAAKSIYWHESFTGTLNPSKSERRVLQYFVLGDRESAIAFLLAASPTDKDFYKHALRALSLASFPPTNSAAANLPRNTLQEKASKVISAHCSSSDDILSSTVILGLVGRTLDAVFQLQDAGMWEHAATMTASYLEGEERRQALERWADHVIHSQKNGWRGLGILLSAGYVGKVLEHFHAEGNALAQTTLLGYLRAHYPTLAPSTFMPDREAQRKRCLANVLL